MEKSRVGRKVDNMTRNMDTIQFESRSELQELINIIEKYVDAYPREKDNRVLKDFYNKLDVMEMEW
jgi:hypothetical protein